MVPASPQAARLHCAGTSGGARGDTQGTVLAGKWPYAVGKREGRRGEQARSSWWKKVNFKWVL